MNELRDPALWVVGCVAVDEAGQQWKKGMDAKEDWQAVSSLPGFTLEVDCNSGRYRQVYRDGRIENRRLEERTCGTQPPHRQKARTTNGREMLLW